MVCVPCLVVPVLLWIWFRFIMPLLWKIKAILLPGSANSANNSNEAAAELKCPFAFSKSESSSAAAKKDDTQQVGDKKSD